ncbi:MAG: MbnP family protein [Crocinitomicaceae bacterium]
MIRFLCIAMLFGAQPLLAQRSLELEWNEDGLEESYEISTLRFYLSTIEFHTSNGVWHTEENSVHLVDLEDADSWKIPLPKDLVKSSIDSVSFLLGIDSVTNVSGILEGDLDPIKGMYWAWNSGYINFKVEGKANKTESHFEYHLGGYLPPFATARKVILARNAKRKKIVLQLNLKQFLDTVNMKELNEVMIPGPEAVLLSDQLTNCFSLE